MKTLFDRRRVILGSAVLAGAVAAPGAVRAACGVSRERWPSEAELVGGNDRELILATAREMMIKLGHAALVTLDDGCLPRVRSVGTRDPEDDLTVWILTAPVTRKVEQIRARPEVVLHYVDSERLAQVTLMGLATLHEDAPTLLEKNKNFYSDEQTRQYFPGFPAGYIMIAVHPLWLEITAPHTPIKGDRSRRRPAGLRL